MTKGDIVERLSLMSNVRVSFNDKVRLVEYMVSGKK